MGLWDFRGIWPLVHEEKKAGVGSALDSPTPHTRKISARQLYKGVTVLNKDDPPAESLRVRGD